MPNMQSDLIGILPGNTNMILSVRHIKGARGILRAKPLRMTPYDPGLIEIMQKGILRFSLLEGDGAKSTLVERLSREEETEYARRLLVIAPYNPRYYLGYAQSKFENTPENFLKNEPFGINEIVYSNHMPERIMSYMSNKFTQLNIVQIAATGEYGEEWQAVTKTVDVDGRIICPMPPNAISVYPSVSHRGLSFITHLFRLTSHRLSKSVQPSRSPAIP